MGISGENDFGTDLAFLNEHLETIVLRNSDGAAVAIVPAYQGRTMTSTAGGDQGNSYGYINYDAIASDTVDSQINLYGGEDRVWVSPEGGQNSIFFDPGVEMTFENWRTPPEIDTHAFIIQNQKRDSVSLSKDAVFTNWRGTKFRLQIDRTVKLLDRTAAGQRLSVDLSGVQLVAHESHNTLVNRGTTPWVADTGLIGVWMICMSKPAPAATVIAPYNIGQHEDPQSLTNADIVTADYFGELDETRLKIDRNKNLLFFRGDGQLRSKLGISPQRAMPILGSWDPDREVLSAIHFNLPESAPSGYNNNLWEIQADPYNGDAVNCYNDGVNDSGSNMGDGGFYEMETISPALALAPDEGYTHIHRTFRIEGPRKQVSSVAEQLFGVDLDYLEAQFR